MASLVTADTIEAWTATKQAQTERGVTVAPSVDGFGYLVRCQCYDGSEAIIAEVGAKGFIPYVGKRLRRKFKTRKAAEIFAANLRKHLENA
jgi:hypothetical protein